ncbi:AMP-binding enzyme [Candidatus Coxiella mudrowiae]|uniref:AMP-binding enzyme n=1 Tax=Candidatus Coxiella mudrowiae TaxID=2054173 RepID=UPI00190FE46B|nr:hypothetical protein [Candidatus Coxiella mudrowiae]
MINISGHRLDISEIEGALMAHSDIAEAAVVGFPHEIKGQGIFAFVMPKFGIVPDDCLSRELINLVRKKLAPSQHPDRIQ